MRCLIPLTCVLILVVFLIPPYSDARQAPKPLFFGLALEGYPLDAANVAQAERSAGVPAGMVVFYLQWPEDPAQMAFPLSTLQTLDALGAAACLTWEPMTMSGGVEHAVPAVEITSGKWDAALDAFARAAAAWGGPLILRFAHEPNLSRYHWGTTATAYGPDSPALYRAMFRHVAGRFDKAGADNVLFAFCPNAESVPDVSWEPTAGWNAIKAYWPGADVVDILGMDGYNWGGTRTLEEHGWQSHWRGFQTIFAPIREELLLLAPDKPLVVFETASASVGGDKDLWARQALETAREWGLAGLVWFQANKEVDWRLNPSTEPDSVAAIRRVAGSALPWLEQLVGRKAGKSP